MPTRIPEGLYPYEVTGPMAMGLVWSGLPQAFLTGVDIARALKQEEWQRKMYEQQMQLYEQNLKYTQGANLLNALFQVLGQTGNIEKAKNILTDEQKGFIATTFGINIDNMLESMPKIKDVFRGASFDLVGEQTGNLAYWLSNLYTVLPGRAIKDIFGNTKITILDEKGQPKEITLSPAQNYVVPINYAQLYNIETRRAMALYNLGFKLQGKVDDRKLKQLQLALQVAKSQLQEGKLEDAQKTVANVLRELNEEYFKNWGAYLLPPEELVPPKEETNWIINILGSILQFIGLKEKTETKTQTPTGEQLPFRPVKREQPQPPSPGR